MIGMLIIGLLAGYLAGAVVEKWRRLDDDVVALLEREKREAW